MEKMKCGICSSIVSKNNLWTHLIRVHKWTLVKKTTPKDVQTTTQPVVRELKAKSSPPVDQKQIKNLLTWALKEPIGKQYTKLYQGFLSKPSSYLSEEQNHLVFKIVSNISPDSQSLAKNRLVLVAKALKTVQKRESKKVKDKARAKAVADSNRQLHVKNGGGSTDIMDQYRGGARLVISGGLPSLGRKK